MSALVERIIAARDSIAWILRSTPEDRTTLATIRDTLADAANALTERDETIHYQRQRLAKVEAFSSVELLNCARYVNEARDAITGADRGRELARMILNIGSAE